MDSIYLELCMPVMGEKHGPPGPSLLRVAHFACRTHLPAMWIFVATRTRSREPGKASFRQNSPLPWQGMALEAIDPGMFATKTVRGVGTV